MDIKTRLEEDKILFANCENKISLSGILRGLKDAGIYTVEDLINYNEKDFPTTSRKTYIAYAQILKNAYLGQDLVFDVLLEKEYVYDAENWKICGENIRECAKDLLRLGFKGPRIIDIHSRIDDFLYKYEGKTFSMEYLLREGDFFWDKGPDIRKYYLEYIDKKKKENNAEITTENMPSVLDGLKIQLQGLLSMREGLDRQIEAIKGQIKSLEEGEKSHGRK